MKKVILSAVTVMAFSAVSFAQASAVAVPVEVAVENADEKGDDKKKVKESELPEAVKTTLASDAYKDWKLVTAWHVMGDNEHYVLEMKKGDETTKLKMNKEGQII